MVVLLKLWCGVVKKETVVPVLEHKLVYLKVPGVRGVREEIKYHTLFCQNIKRVMQKRVKKVAPSSELKSSKD